MSNAWLFICSLTIDMNKMMTISFYGIAIAVGVRMKQHCVDIM